MGGVAEIHSVMGWSVGRWWQDVRLLEMRLSLAQHCLVRADVDLHERVAALSQIESALVRQSTRVGMPHWWTVCYNTKAGTHHPYYALLHASLTLPCSLVPHRRRWLAVDRP